MRLPVIFAALLVAAGGLAGCFGGEEEPATPAADGGDGGINDPTKLVEQIKVLAPLKTSITTTAPDWIKSGTSIDLTAAKPSGAKGALTYTWAVGQLPGTVTIAAKADTGSKTPNDYIPGGGKSASIKYTEAGIYRMHCHPHPYMKHNVTVVDGYKGPSTVNVTITDGAKLNEYRFVPEEIIIGKGTTVVYTNVGQLPHSATAESQEPPLKKLDLATDTGAAAIDGNGWMRVMVIVTDAEGRIGSAEHKIYVTPELPSWAGYSGSFTFNVGTGGVIPMGTLPADPEAPKTDSVTLTQGGAVFLNFTVADASAPATPPAEAAPQVEIHFRKAGGEQDALASPAATSGALTGSTDAGAYELVVIPMRGVQMTATVTIDVIYDLVPPPLVPVTAGGDGHGHSH